MKAGFSCHLANDRRGIAALEFAMIAPIFMLLLFGVTAFGLYLSELIAVTVAAAEGARSSVGALSADNPVSIASSAACNVINGYAPLMTCSSAVISAVATGTSMSVTVTYPLPARNIFSLMPVTPANPSSTSTAQYKSF